MRRTTLACFRCDRKLSNIDAAGVQPSSGTAFISYGHYGSTLFDPMDPTTWLELAVCDECLKSAAQQGRVFLGKGSVGRPKYSLWNLVRPKSKGPVRPAPIR